jgi:hypothetical protein
MQGARLPLTRHQFSGRPQKLMRLKNRLRPNPTTPSTMAPTAPTPNLLDFTPAESAFAKACHQAAEDPDVDPTAKVTARFRFLDLFTYTMVCARLYGALARDHGPALRFENVRLLDGSDRAWAWAWLDTQTGRLVYGNGNGEGAAREEAGVVTARLAVATATTMP